MNHFPHARNFASASNSSRLNPALNRQTQSHSHWTDALITPVLSGTYLFSSLALFGLGQYFLSVSFFCMWGITSPHILAQVVDQMPRIRGIHRLPSFASFALIVGLAGGLLLGAGLFTPAHAQFLEAAETGAAEIVGGLGGDAANLEGIIAFIFGALRLLLVIYMAIALIQIVNAARQGEEWKDLMRTPLMVILVVVVGDFIAGVIFGGGGAAGGAG